MASLASLAQESDGYGVNLPKFYKKKMHFGLQFPATNAILD
jgi:hypothetical protein